jgi:hypothetical protein
MDCGPVHRHRHPCRNPISPYPVVSDGLSKNTKHGRTQTEGLFEYRSSVLQSWRVRNRWWLTAEVDESPLV